MKASWKTTVTGITTIVVAVAGAVKCAVTTGIATVPWEATIAAITSGIGLITARDNNVSSEQAGAK